MHLGGGAPGAAALASVDAWVATTFPGERALRCGLHPRRRARNTIALRTRAGPDGVLMLSVPVGMSGANREVKVVVESVEGRVGEPSGMTQEEWSRFVAATASA